MIIGVAGTLGAGKGEVAKYLAEKYGFAHYSFREFFVEEIKKRGLPVDRDSMRVVANDLRENFGGDYIIRVLTERSRGNGENAVAESIRAPIEADFLLNTDGTFMFAVDADPKLRYERAVLRGSETDKVTFEQFLEHERKETETMNPAEQNLQYCIKKTKPEFLFTNNGTLDELHTQIDEAMKLLQK